MKLTEEQQRAIESPDESLAVVAGAGAGKTRVLVERYLGHVLDEGISPEQILAITYTRKAAAEMKARIVRRLRELGRNEDARLAQVGPISTIHSLCERLLREYPFDAGIDPKFEVLPEGESSEIVRQAVRRALVRSETLGESTRTLIHRIGGERQRGVFGGSSARLLDWVGRTIDKSRVMGLRPDDIAPFADNPVAVLAWWDDFLDSQIETDLGERPPRDWKLNTKQLKAVYRAAGRSAPKWFNSDADPPTENDAAILSAGLSELSTIAWRELLAEFDRLRALDFNELEYRACALLQARPEALKGKYLRLMCDEAQDLNPMQHRILDAMPVERRLFVGDPQQSIFRFRGAVRSLFVEKVESLPTVRLTTNWRSTTKILRAVDTVFAPLWPTDYVAMRSPDDVLTTDGDPFESVEGTGVPIEIWRTQRNKWDDGTARGLSSLIEEGIDPGSITVLIREHWQVDSLAVAMRSRGVPFSIAPNVGRNYFLRAEIYDLASALRAACDPYDTLPLLSLLRSPLVGITLNSVAKLGLDAQENGDSVWQILLTGPQTGSPSDDELLKVFLEWFEPLTKSADRLPAWQVLSEVFGATKIDARLARMPDGPQLIANTRRLLSVAADRGEMGAREFADWIESQQQLRVRWGDAASQSDSATAVRITTVHQAKGLEWDVVVVCGRAGRKKALEPPATHETLVTPVVPVGDMKPMVYRLLEYRESEAALAEEQRLLYVAMTRAQSRLVVVVPDSVAGDAWAPKVRDRLAPNWQGSESVKVRDLTQDSAPAHEVATRGSKQ